MVGIRTEPSKITAIFNGITHEMAFNGMKRLNPLYNYSTLLFKIENLGTLKLANKT